MPAIVIPFRGAGKSRLAVAGPMRTILAEAMLADVCAAAAPVGRVIVARGGAGQGAAVTAVLHGLDGPALVVNADLPCATTADLERLLTAAPALVAAADGTTNALALADASHFAPLYGPGSAVRFAAALGAAALDLPNLADDVDSITDLERTAGRAGRHTRAAFALLERAA